MEYMKKSIILILIILVNVLSSIGQLLYPTQPEKGHYEDLKSRIIPFVPSEDQLAEAKALALPANFKDTLLKYDWYEIASYHVYEKKYHTYFGMDLAEREKNNANNEFIFKRYTSSGIVYEMKLDRYKDGSIKVFTTTFDENTAEKLLDVKKSGLKNMMVTSVFGETEMQEILSYTNGLMIKKVKQTPKTTTKIFIIACMAVPKSF